ncbi:hypothetical protein FRC17_001260 [Serendipita sp. 399]|nr:hypothetical protein FRC17_001260 [Serendipita sp. 399]
MLGTSASFYVTYKTLAQPMPFLWRLCLTKSPDPSLYPTPGLVMGMRPPMNEKDMEYTTKPITWFSGVTPNLKELDFTHIHAPWHDPIYANLTRLRINTPETRLKVSQLLRVLRQCPSMEYLELTECFSRPPRHAVIGPATAPHMPQLFQLQQLQQMQQLGMQGQIQQAIEDDIGKDLFRVDLPKLWYLHLQESTSASSSHILSYITCPRLETLALCAPGSSSIAGSIRVADESDGYGRSPHTRAFESIFHLLSTTTQLQFLHSNQNQTSVIGRVDDDKVARVARWAYHGDTIKKVPGKGWSFSYVVGAVVVCVVISQVLRIQTAALQRSLSAIPSPMTHVDRLRETLYHQVDLLQQLDVAGVCYHLIEKIDLGGNALYIDQFYESLFSQCINLKRLRLRTTPLALTAPSPLHPVPQAPLDVRPLPHKMAMQVLGEVIADRLCSQLEEVHISWFAASAAELADWVELRASRVKRLRKVVVDVYELASGSFLPELDDMGEESSELDEESKMRIEAALEKTEDHSAPRFVWGNPERERMREVHEYYMETYGFKDRDIEMDAEMQS